MGHQMRAHFRRYFESNIIYPNSSLCYHFEELKELFIVIQYVVQKVIENIKFSAFLVAIEVNYEIMNL